MAKAKTRTYVEFPSRKVKGEYSASTLAVAKHVGNYHALRKEERDIAGKINSVKGALIKICNVLIDKRIEKNGTPPQTPISFKCYNDAEVDYVLSDKSGSQAIDADTMAVLEEMFNEDQLKKLIMYKTSVKLNATVMKQTTTSGKLVSDVIFEKIREALNESDEFSDLQKAELIKIEEKPHAVPGLYKTVKKLFPRMKQAAITGLFNALSSQYPRYLHK